MEEDKLWWQSRTIWTGILTAICAILKGFHLLPKEIDESMIGNIVTVGLGLATIYFRIRATKVIVPAVPTTPAPPVE